MNQTSVQQIAQARWGLILKECIQCGIKWGAILGAIYGLFTGLFFGLIIGPLIGMSTGLIGGIMLALMIYAWRKWLQPATLSEQAIRWLAPLPIGFSYLVVCYQISDAYQGFRAYINDLLMNIMHFQFLSIFVTWSLLIMSVTLIIVIPSILHETQAY
ncbi:hypothetical protein [Herpetosiphon giganteus]|uniref:hypothetical protein n=1 Tax=Herpetosiphon giganteus TaxID=2029754 RepID=UPI00195B304E|nr:hypothetical protein [Herpetosiphon giganteus]MBM7843828.1 hypothetical protein [Herpetosiphon giganteus]